MLVAEDTVDSFHSWDHSNPHWTETFWYGAWIPEIATTVYVYHWFRPVLGIYGGGCLVWDAGADLPWDIPVFNYDVNLPLPETVDLRRLRLPSGASLTSLEEGWRYDIAYARGDVEVALRFEAVTPPDIVTAQGMTEFFAGHIDQAGRYTGHLALGGRRHAIDCFGIRDRSWGPRVISDDICMNYCHGQSEALAFVVYTKPDGQGADRVFKGYLAAGGQRLDLTGGVRRSRWQDGALARIELDATDAEGRRLTGFGVPRNRLVYQPYPNLVSWLYLMEWQVAVDGGAPRTIWGEEQEAWSQPLWHRRDRRWRP
jgi:hypothetical protein